MVCGSGSRVLAGMVTYFPNLVKLVVNPDAGGAVMRQFEASKAYKRRQDSLKRRSFLSCRRWTVWAPVSLLVLVAVCMYLKGHPADLNHWHHSNGLSSERNLTYYYKVSLPKA